MYSDSNLLAFCSFLGNYNPVEYSQEEDFVIVSSSGYAWPNQLMRLSKKVDELESFVMQYRPARKSKALPDLLVLEVGDSARLEWFKSKTFKTGKWTAMTHNLKQIPKANLTGLKIETIQYEEDLKHWLRIAETELMGGIPLSENLFQDAMAVQSLELYLAKMDGVPCAAALNFYHEGEAGIYFVACLSNFRNQGIGSVITTHCLEQAKEAGMRMVHIQATDAGVSIYQKVGFEDSGMIPLVRLQ